MFIVPLLLLLLLLLLDRFELFPVTSKNALGHTSQYSYDYHTGKVASVIDPNGITYTYGYHPLYGYETSATKNGLLLRSENNSSRVMYEYNYQAPILAVGQTAKQNNATLVKTSYLNSLGLVYNVNSTDGGTYQSYADELGREIVSCIPNTACNATTNVITKNYDINGDLASTITPFGTTSYSRSGLTLAETNPKGAQ